MIENETMDLLTALSTQIENYPSMYSFYKESLSQPSLTLSPLILTELERTFSFNHDMLYESITFLDTMSMLSLFSTGDGDYLLDKVIDILVRNREAGVENLGINRVELENILYDDSTEERRDTFRSLLNSNKHIVSMFTYAMITKLTFK